MEEGEQKTNLIAIREKSLSASPFPWIWIITQLSVKTRKQEQGKELELLLSEMKQKAMACRAHCIFFLVVVLADDRTQDTREKRLRPGDVTSRVCPSLLLLFLTSSGDPLQNKRREPRLTHEHERKKKE